MLHVQALESRRLMSVSLLGSALQIVGGPGNDTYTIAPLSGAIKVTENGTGYLIPSAGITRIFATLGAGNDVLETLPSILRPMTVDGGSGNDELTTGGNSDRVFGGPGADRVWAGGGNDVIFGGVGDARYDSPADAARDSLVGGTGDDIIEAAGFNPTGFGPTGLSGGDGNDRLTGHAGKCIMDGGNGDDTFNGGLGDEEMFGGLGRDTLYGGGGSDKLNGNDGDDLLDGGAYGLAAATNTGNDLLHGNAGNDTLIAPDFGTGDLFGDGGHDFIYGSRGNDDLYGGAGNDYLSGGDGDDGLLGGLDTDRLTGGLGDDRFVDRTWNVTIKGFTRRYWEDAISDRTSSDARIGFESGSTITINVGGEAQTYEGATWSQAEIEMYDRGFRTLHDATRNTRLLKLRLGGDQIFVRQGNRIDVLGGDWANGWNSGGTIHISTLGIPMREARALQTMFHEVGHSWDDEPGWLELSGWTMTDMSTNPAYTQIRGSAWWRLASAEFASVYALTSPHEDFADSFAANMLDRSGLLDWSASVSIVALKNKFINGMLFRLM